MEVKGEPGATLVFDLGKIPDEGGVDAAGGRDRQGVHVGEVTPSNLPAVYWFMDST
jgi:hypothetical protein